jgi:hypothetical protein
MGMNKYLVTVRIKGQLVKTAVHANSAIHARLICKYQFGMACVQVTSPRFTAKAMATHCWVT